VKGVSLDHLFMARRWGTDALMCGAQLSQRKDFHHPSVVHRFSRKEKAPSCANHRNLAKIEACQTHFHLLLTNESKNILIHTQLAMCVLSIFFGFS